MIGLRRPGFHKDRSGSPLRNGLGGVEKSQLWRNSLKLWDGDLEGIAPGENCSKSRDNLGLWEAVDIRGIKEGTGQGGNIEICPYYLNSWGNIEFGFTMTKSRPWNLCSWSPQQFHKFNPRSPNFPVAFENLRWFKRDPFWCGNFRVLAHLKSWCCGWEVRCQFASLGELELQIWNRFSQVGYTGGPGSVFLLGCQSFRPSKPWQSTYRTSGLWEAKSIKILFA